MIKRLAFLAAAIALAGCASQGGYQGMSADQLAALAKMKDANVNCTKGSTLLLGSFLTVFVNLDKGVIPEGGISVSPDCAVTVTNSKVVTTTTTVVKPAQ
jgi:hypothetical protein